jgi:ubiquitin-conjugating enzyme E2 W
MQDHLPPGIAIVKCENLEEWQMDIKVLDQNPLYLDQTYRLKFTFSNKYPIGKIDPPALETKPSSPLQMSFPATNAKIPRI